MRKMIVLFIFALSFCLPQEGMAVPNVISYQGVLNHNGQPLSGSVEIVFTIYDSTETSLWSETQTVEVSNGIFNVELGSVQAFPETLFKENGLYLGIKVGTDSEMRPLQRITSNAFSQRADILTYGLPIGSITAWAKSIPGVPGLPDGWAECNGQMLSDEDSPLNGQVIPDLNSEHRFLRGHTVSGNTGGQESVTSSTNDRPHQANGSSSYVFTAASSGHVHTVETIPPYYSVVWIIKVK